MNSTIIALAVGAVVGIAGTWLAMSMSQKTAVSREPDETLQPLTSDNLIDLWKTWNRMVWLAPVAFLATLSALGATLAYTLENGQAVSVTTNVLIGTSLVFAGLVLLVSVYVLGRFLQRRDLVGATFESNVGGARAAQLVQVTIGLTASLLLAGGLAYFSLPAVPVQPGCSQADPCSSRSPAGFGAIPWGSPVSKLVAEFGRQTTSSPPDYRWESELMGRSVRVHAFIDDRGLESGNYIFPCADEDDCNVLWRELGAILETKYGPPVTERDASVQWRFLDGTRIMLFAPTGDSVLRGVARDFYVSAFYTSALAANRVSESTWRPRPETIRERF